MKESAFLVNLHKRGIRPRRSDRQPIWNQYAIQQAIPPLISPGVTTDVLGTEDLVVGTILAFSLALLGAYLQGRGNQNNFVLWKNKQNDESIINLEEKNEFGEEAWKDVSRPENYILYTTKVREQQSGKNQTPSPFYRSEKKYVLFALLLLFVPIFSFEFFLALSRQITCGGSFLSQNAWAEQLCSPHFEP